MARRVFFSFHHKKDSFRVAKVRNSWLGQKGASNTFLDAAAWEKVERLGDAVVKAWIDKELHGTGVTVVLIGQETANRRFVKYEIQESFKKKSGLLGIYIHGIKDGTQKLSRKGKNPLDDHTAKIKHPLLGIFGYEIERRYSEIFETFDWIEDDGRKNLTRWIEEAARRAGR